MATVNGKTHTGTIGATGDYNPNAVKRVVSEQYRIDYPDAKNVAVVILDVKEVSSEQYKEASKSMIHLTTKKED